MAMSIKRSKEVHLFIESIRPSEYIRNDLDIVYNINDRTIDIGEQRPVWQGEAGEKRPAINKNQVHPLSGQMENLLDAKDMK